MADLRLQFAKGPLRIYAIGSVGLSLETQAESKGRPMVCTKLSICPLVSSALIARFALLKSRAAHRLERLTPDQLPWS